MANYTIGGHSSIDGRGGTSLEIGTALQIENKFQFTNLPNWVEYPNPLSNHWKLEGAYWISNGSMISQNIEPTMLCQVDGVKFGCFLWCNNSNIPEGVYPNDLPLIESLGDFIIVFCAYDDNGIYNYIQDRSYTYIVSYEGATISYHPQDECYIRVYTVLGSLDGGVYVCNSPSNLMIYPLPTIPPSDIRAWLYYKPLALDTGIEYNNSRSFWWKIAKRDGTVISVDTIPKEADTSTSGGGGGSFNIDSDVIDFPSVPTVGFANSGLGRLYHATENELEEFAHWLYQPSIIDTIARMWSNPLDLIVSLGIVPIMPTHLGYDETVHIGYTDSGVYMTPITNQYEVLDCGTINIDEFYASSLDYGQYCKISIFLPYIGVRELKTDEVMGGSVTVRYVVDLATGSCLAMIKCVRQGLEAVLYQFEGNVFIQVPLIARDFSQVYQSVIRGVADATMCGNPATAVSGAVNSAINVMGSKPLTQKSGSIGASGGFMGIKKPFLIIERAIQSLAENFGHFKGYPCNITKYLYSVTGYTEVEDIHLDNFGTATTEELERIKDKLKKGVIL